MKKKNNQHELSNLHRDFLCQKKKKTNPTKQPNPTQEHFVILENQFIALALRFFCTGIKERCFFFLAQN